MKVRDLMKYPITTVKPEVAVLDAVKIMANEGKGCVLVAREGLLKKCMGIFTTTQISVGSLRLDLILARLK